MTTSRGREFVLVASLLGATAWVLQHRARSWWEGEGLWSGGVGEAVAVGDEFVRHAVWDEPRAISGAEPGITRLALAPDGRTAVFSAGTRGLNAELYLAELVGGALVDARPIAGLNSAADDVAPAFSRTHLYFASDRGGGAGGLDLWRAEWTPDGFGVPEPLFSELQSGADDTDPAPTMDGDRIVFASDRDGDFDLWCADAVAPDTGAWSLARLDGACSERDEREPVLTAEGRVLTFASARDGRFELLRTTRTTDAWSTPSAVFDPPVDADDRAPCFDATGFELVFLRANGEGVEELLRARSREVFELSGRPWTWFDSAVVASLLLLALAAWLARRWPALELIYKCMLVSVLLHLLLLFLLQYFFLTGGSAAPREEERRRVRYAPSERPSAMVERAGELEVARAFAPEAAPERAEVESELERPSASTSVPLVELDTERARAPERSAVDRAPASATRPMEVALESPREARAMQDTPARDLELVAHARMESTVVPERADAADLERASAPSTELGLAAPSAASNTAPPRTVVESNARTPAGPERVAVERPNEPRAARSEAPARLALEPSTAPRGGDESPTPERASVANTARIPGTRASGPERTAALVEAPEGDAAANPERARVEHGPTGAPQATANAVAVENPREAAAVRSGARTELALEPSPQVGGGDAAARGPERADGSAVDRDTRAAPTSAAATLAAAPADSTEKVPARGAVETASSGGAAKVNATVAAPADARGEEARAERASGAAELELGEAARAAVVPLTAGAERVAIASPGGRAQVGAPEPGRLELSTPKASDESADLPSRGRVDAPEEARAPRVALERDRAPSPRATRPAEPTPDVLDGLAPSARVPETTAAEPRPLELDRPAPAPDRARASERAPLAQVPERAAELPPAVERERWDHTPYENRSAENKAKALELHGGDERTEEAVARGLAYLARVQQRGGQWGRADARDPKYGQVAVGKTGLALLAFLGAGHTHRSGTEYSRTVERALRFLVAEQDQESGHLGEGDAYSHGIAAYALAECLAMTGDDALRPPIEKAVARILAAQDHNRDPRLRGGWSYFYADGRVYDRWPRTAITAWQVMALESARLSGVVVPDTAFDGAREFLLAAQNEDDGHFLYSHDPERLSDRYSTLPASTPAGMFALSLLGAELAGDEWGSMRRFVLERRPNGYRYANDDEFVFRGTGNLYFWYYGTLAMFRAGGASWKTWNEGMKATLVPAQAADGSWAPIDPYARYARDDERDKSYTTALCVLSLEVYYRYYLPLLKVK